MELPISTGRLAETLQQVCRHWESKRKAEAACHALAPPEVRAHTIALAREMGTQGTAVAQEIGRRLQWPVLDRELLDLIAGEMGTRANLLESVDEKPLNWLAESIEALSAENYVSESGYVRHLVKTVLALGSYGECVIVGRGAAHILPAESTLRVRLVAPVKDRVALTRQKLGITLEEAAQPVETIDRFRLDFVQHHFFKDPTDPANYDLILNTSRFSTNECAELIVDALHCICNGGIKKDAVRTADH